MQARVRLFFVLIKPSLFACMDANACANNSFFMIEKLVFFGQPKDPDLFLRIMYEHKKIINQARISIQFVLII